MAHGPSNGEDLTEESEARTSIEASTGCASIWGIGVHADYKARMVVKSRAYAVRLRQVTNMMHELVVIKHRRSGGGRAEG